MNEHSPVILLIEDEPQMRRLLRRCLKAQGHRHIEAGTGRLGLDLARSHLPSLVLLDLGLPDMDGRDVVRTLREWSEIPILVLSACGSEDEKVAVLDAGADDYLTKPFGAGELAARIRAALRHASLAPKEHDARLDVGSFRVEHEQRRVVFRDEELQLSPTEYKLLRVLLKNAGRVVTHRELLHEVWGPAHANDTHYLRVYMSQLRQKLESEPARPRTLVTEPCVGYRLKSE